VKATYVDEDVPPKDNNLISAICRGYMIFKFCIQYMHTLMLRLMAVYFTDYVENLYGVDIKSEIN